jgi:hypothetical protein
VKALAVLALLAFFAWVTIQSEEVNKQTDWCVANTDTITVVAAVNNVSWGRACIDLYAAR